MLRHIEDVDASVARADVCIIGSGAAGITIALELKDTPLRVIVLEGGERHPDPAHQALYDADVVGLQHEGINDQRFRVFGGSTTRWAGQALPLFDIDFEKRDWVPHSGWPLTRDELDPYYRRASERLGVPPFPRRPLADWASGPLPPVSFDPRLVESFVSAYSPTPDFAHTYGPSLARSASTEVLLGANVVDIASDPGLSYIESVCVQSLTGKRLEVRAEFFVLCCGGIESVRILLASTGHSDAGLGNQQDLVGRFFQDHPGLIVGPLRDPLHPELGERFAPHHVGAVRYRTSRFRSADELQQREALLHCYGEVVFRFHPAVEAANEVLLAMRRRERPADLRPALRLIAGNLFPVAEAMARHAARRPRSTRSAQMYLAVGCEQAPNPRSRLFLTDKRDQLGMRRLALDWQLTQAEVDSVRRFAEIAGGELKRLGLGEVDLEAFKLPDDPKLLSGVFWDFAHHMGATRMAHTPDDGVVDSTCQVFGLANLYIGSTAVFPTSGFSNPTLTLIALCIRIADSIRERNLPQATTPRPRPRSDVDDG